MKKHLAMITVLGLTTCAVHGGPTPDTLPLPSLKYEDIGGVMSLAAGSDGSTVVSFAARPNGEQSAYAAGGALADLGVSSGAFVGNYKTAGIKGLTFKMASDGHLPASATLVLKAKNGDTWINSNVKVTDAANAWALNNVSLDRAAGWDISVPAGYDKDVLWAKALLNVTAIGMRLAAKGEAAQTYAIKDFMLVGANGFSAPAKLTALQQQLLNKFGVTSVAAVGSAGSQDSNGNGMSDLDEALANSQNFLAEVVNADESGVTVKWSSAAEWMTYTVLRTKALNEPFVAVKGLTTASPEVTIDNGQMTWTDTDVKASEGPYFYKVVGTVQE